MEVQAPEDHALALKPSGHIRLDQWTQIGIDTDSNGMRTRMTAECVRPVGDLEEAIAYAKHVQKFLLHNGLVQSVFVLVPPESTAKSKYEVALNTCGYNVAYSTDLNVDVHLSPAQQRDILLDAMKSILANQMGVWKRSGFTEEQIKRMPYLKAGFRAVELASS